MDIPTSAHPQDRLIRFICKSAYIAAFAFLVFKVFEYHHSNFGYSTLPMFSNHFHEQSLSILKETPHYTYQDDYGYDGQFYAQLALVPSAKGEEIERALDNYVYRSRRILFSWTAWAMGLGKPYWIIQAYGIQNALFWALTALLLLRWLPPENWQNTLRFIACFFTAGFVYSFNRALLDGPSLFLIALGALLLETRRSWMGTAVLGLGGLGKETNLLAITALWEPGNLRKKLNTRFFIQAGIAALPFLLWFIYVSSSTAGDSSQVLGIKNFDLPLVGFFSAALEILKEGGETGFPASMYVKFAILGSLLIQGIYLLVRPKPNRVWWRIGVAYAVLMLVLGQAVWDGTQAAPRVLLPMTIAFNLLFSRKLILLPVLVFANTLTFVGLSSFQPLIIEERPDMAGRSDLAYNAETNEYSKLQFAKGWSKIEAKKRRYWIWCSGDGEITFDIPGKRNVNAAFYFIPKTLSSREVITELNGQEIWRIRNEELYGDPQTIPVVLIPGENLLRFYSPSPPERIGEDPRDLSFALVNYELQLLNAVPAEN